jgi:heme-binding NEAT domain protein
MLQFVVLTLICMSAINVYAESPDGTFLIDYQVLNSDSDSVSISNDYFYKPATLFIEDGEKYIQFTVNHSEWIKELQTPLGETFVDVDIVSEDKEEDTRTVRFKLEEDLSQPVEFKMHILVESMEPVYDHRYTARFDFDADKMEEIESAVVSSVEEIDNDEVEVAADTDNEKQDEKSEKSGSKTIVLIVIVLAMAALLITRPWKTKKN